MKRSLCLPRHAVHARNIAELCALARRRLPHFIFEYLEGGAEDEITLAANRQAFDRWRWRPDTLVDTSRRDLRIRLFGTPLAAPVLIAPTGYNGMLHPHADVALARAAREAGIPFIQSTVSNASIETIARETGVRHWLQLYLLKDRAVTQGLLDRARDAGCEALVLTTDAVHFGNREWDRRNYRRPMKLTVRAMFDAALHPRWMANVMVPHGIPRFGNLAPYLPPERRSALGGADYFASQMDDTLSWDSVNWLRERWQGKLLIKGILQADDALRARRAGADGIVLSNHGGRQLDGCLPPLLALAAVRAACGPDYPVLIDGGFRRGSDLAKALALGATAVLLGRPVLYGVAAGGEAGAARALTVLRQELDRTLAQLGCRSIAELGPRLLQPC